MYDLVIRNGRITDGSGAASTCAALYIQGDRIAKIDTDETLPAAETVDARGLTVAPGFIDMHTHSDTAPWNYPGFEGRLHQGVTTDIAGNCGASPVPVRARDGEKPRSLTMAGLREELGEMRFGCNFNCFIGHGTLRTLCMADPYAPVPRAEELEAMREALRQELRSGAVGLSLGLEYMPGACCETEELVELARVVKEFDGVVAVHMRNEDDRVFEALEEVHRIARESGAHLHISHFKVSHKPQWGKAEAALAALDAMQTDSFVTADQYPFTAFSTGIKSLLPFWAKKGSYEEITARFDDEAAWREIRSSVEENIERAGGPDVIFVAGNKKWPETEGKSLREIGEMLGLLPVDAYKVIMKRCGSNVSGVTHAMAREDVLTILRREDLALISDSGSRDFVTGDRSGKPHPRSTSSAAKFLRLVREEQLMPLEKAVAKMTSLPARLLGLKDRGLLREGFFADVVIFDPETVAERGTYAEPFRTAVGIDRVYVNGKLAWAEEKPEALAGRFAERK